MCKITITPACSQSSPQSHISLQIDSEDDSEDTKPGKPDKKRTPSDDNWGNGPVVYYLVD